MTGRAEKRRRGGSRNECPFRKWVLKKGENERRFERKFGRS